MSDLLAFRQALALSQTEMAALLGVNRAHLSRLERGERDLTGLLTVRLNVLRALAREPVLEAALRTVNKPGSKGDV